MEKKFEGSILTNPRDTKLIKKFTPYELGLEDAKGDDANAPVL